MVNRRGKSPRHIQTAGPTLLVLVVFAGCQTRESKLYDTVYACDSAGPTGECGSTRDGKPMTCYPGHLVDGQDFCVPTCDTTASSDDRFTCLTTDTNSKVGALLQRCKPGDPEKFGCPDKLACYRTDLLTDEGVCLMMTVCTEQADCASRRAGSICAGGLVRGLVADTSQIQSGNLQCIQSSCTMQGSMCPPDQACLLNNYSSEGKLPDICVPKCRAGTCPPNFACSQDASNPSSPSVNAICLPGIPGTRCNGSADCLFGECLDTGAGFKVCTLPLPCKPVDYCSTLDGPVDVFVCAEGVPGQPRCVTSRPFVGANCKETQDCAPGSGRECMWLSPTQAKPTHGDCRLPCDAEGRCAPRGGMPFFCLGENREGGCFPSGFGLPCLDDSECNEKLSCETVGPDERSRTNYNPNICTLPCMTDADCDANHLTFHAAFCQIETGFCRLAGETGLPCTQPSHCRSKQCNSVTGTCF